MNTPIKYSADKTLDGTSPIVILGPNGSGKTRYGHQLASWNNADIVVALRNIALDPNIPMQSLSQADQELKNQKQQHKKRPWLISSEINNLFAKLMAEDSAAAIRFRDNYQKSPGVAPDITKLMRLSSAWERLFPGRHISFAGYVPTVTSEYVAGEQAYAAQQMSDGERVALYLAARVLDSDAPVILIDEPEVHFHSRLAVQFWDELERLRSDCRFVYITHDLTFARSRQTSQFLIVRPGREPDLMDFSQGVPSDIAESILSAASFSIYADTLVFCEGTESSLDQELLRSWFRKRSVAVIPVGSCRDVIRCATTFSKNKLLANVTAMGIIDCDYWPDSFLNSVPEGIGILPVHEVESAFCVRGLFYAVALHIGKTEGEATVLYDEFLADARGRFTDGLLLKQVSERFRTRCEEQVRRAVNELSVDGDEATVKENHCLALSPERWNVQPEEIFSEEKQVIQSSFVGQDESGFLKLLPGKVYLPLIVKRLGLSKDAYIELVTDSLAAETGTVLAPLGVNIRKALKSVIPFEG